MIIFRSHLRSRLSARRNKRAMGSEHCSLLPTGQDGGGPRIAFSVVECQEASRNGCLNCALILSAIKAYDPKWCQAHVSDGSRIYREIRDGALAVTLMLGDGWDGWKLRFFGVNVGHWPLIRELPVAKLRKMRHFIYHLHPVPAFKVYYDWGMRFIFILWTSLIPWLLLIGTRFS